jgi:DNA-binding response OmpR family regulator
MAEFTGHAGRRRILAVDDDEAILDVVRLNLEAEGFEVAVARSVAEALSVLDARPCVLAVLDIMLPDGDGIELARRIREHSDIPILMLSARDTDVDKAVGFGVGADDYMTKPFSSVELVARVKAHLRRYEGRTVLSDAEVLEVGQLRVDISRRAVTVSGSPADLTAKEFDILQMLAAHPGRVYTKAQIYEHVWGEEPFGDLGTVQVHMRRLRMKIEADPEHPRLVTTVWGIGYRLEEVPVP